MNPQNWEALKQYLGMSVRPEQPNLTLIPINSVLNKMTELEERGDTDTIQQKLVSAVLNLDPDQFLSLDILLKEIAEAIQYGHTGKLEAMGRKK